MKKLWHGDVPLSVAYWVYGWLLPMGLALVFVILGITLVPGSVPARLFVLVIGCYTVFWGVGTWRAASKYQGLKLWAVLAKAHIVAPLVLLAFAFATLAVVRTNQNSAVSHAVQEPMAENPRPVGLNTEGGALREKPALPIAPHRDQGAAGMGDNSRAGAIPVPELATEQVAPASAQPSEQGAVRMATSKPYTAQPTDTIDFDEVMRRIEAMPSAAPVAKPERLGWLDQRRYESCQQDAAKAPTAQGVVAGLRICREKFDQ